ncbi:MAG: SRPBCC family protein [Pseudomonadota bacterium]
MAIELKHVFRTPPERVWEVIGDPGRVDWVAGVESAVFDGEVRRFQMTGAGQLAEQILTLDGAQKLIEYSVVESTPALVAHRASMQVFLHDEGSELVWKTEVAPENVEPFIEAGMQGSIAGLHDVLGCE